jgi:glucose-6-phosphate 1-dehydrogenase
MNFHAAVKQTHQHGDAFANKIQYIQGDFLKEETFINLKAKLDLFDANNKQRGTRMFYFAVSPKFIEVIA